MALAMALGDSLLSDERVKGWHSNLTAGSKRTAEGYLSWLAQYCTYRNKSPVGLIEEFNRDKMAAQDGLANWIGILRARDLAPKTLNGALSGVKSWFVWNDCEIKRAINVGNTHSTPTIEDEAVPSKAEFKEALDHADIRQKLVCSLIGFCGIRFDIMSKLRLKDLPELHIKGTEVVIDEPVMRVRIVSTSSKNKRAYFVFLISQGSEWLRQYLTGRIRGGEKLGPESHLLVSGQRVFSNGRFIEKGEPIGRQAISQDVRKALRAAGLPQRPYVLKSYFDLALQVAKVQNTREEFYLGHEAGIAAVYGIRKQLAPEIINDMRREFIQQVEPVLSTAPTSGQVQIDEATRHTLLKMAGYSDGQINEMQKVAARLKPKDADAFWGNALTDRVLEIVKSREPGATVTTEEVQSLVGTGPVGRMTGVELDAKGLKRKVKVVPPSKWRTAEGGIKPPAQTQEPPQKIIDTKKLPDYLKRHWTWVANVDGSNKVIVQRPKV